MRTTFTLCLLVLLPSLVLRQQATATPISFIANQGQWEHPGQFVAAIPGGWLFLEANRFTYNLQPGRGVCRESRHNGAKVEELPGHAWRVHLLGANPTPVLVGEEQQLTYYNYFIGNQKFHWKGQVPGYAGMRYRQLYPGIDLRWHQTAKSELEYDFEVAPGAAVNAIRLRYEGLSGAPTLTRAGNLHLRTSLGEVEEQAPVAWQTDWQGHRRAVTCRFNVKGSEVSFELGPDYDSGQALTIDPTLVFATYTGSVSGMSANATATDAQGSMYFAGASLGPIYPVTMGAYMDTRTGADMVVGKLAPDGRTLVYATYLGGITLQGQEPDYPLDMQVDAAGNLVVLGQTTSYDYPTTAGAFQPQLAGGQDFVVSRLNSTGSSLLSSTFLGGSALEGGELSERPGSLDIDASSGDILVAGTTRSANFPVGGAFQSTFSGQTDGVLVRLSGDLRSRRWGTYLGGAAQDEAHCVKVAPNGEVYVSGRTMSSNFPVMSNGLYPTPRGSNASPNYDGYVLRFTAGGSRTDGTYLGTAAHDVARFLDFDPDGNVVVGGATEGRYLLSPGVFSAVLPSGSAVFIQGLTPNLQASLFSTQLTLSTANLLTGPLYQGCNLLTAFGMDACGQLYLCAYGAQIARPGAPRTPDALTQNASTFYVATLSRNATSLRYGTFIGEPTPTALPNGNTHLHYAASGKVTRQGTLYQLACTTSSQFGTTPGAFSPTRLSQPNDGVAFKLDLVASSAGASAVIAPVAPGCAPFTTQFAALGASSFYQYRWSFGDGSPVDTTAAPLHTFPAGTYTIRLQVRLRPGVLLCGSSRLVDSTQVTLVVNSGPPPPLAQVPGIAPGCAPYPVQFGNQSTGTGLHYNWNFGDGSPADTTQFPLHTYFNPGSYTVTLTVSQTTPACGRRESRQQVPVVVSSAAPVLVGQIAPLPAVCLGSPTELQALHNGAQGFRWDFGDGSPIDTTAAPRHTYSTAGTYTVRLNLVRGATGNCAAANLLATQTVVVQQPPLARFQLDSLDCQRQLVLSPNVPGTLTTRWSGAAYGDGNTLLVRYPGTYQATIQLASQPCPLTLSYVVKEATPRLPPNIITPNGDRHNDVFVVPAAFGYAELRIFNRWGQLVYESAAYANDWSAADLPGGIYYYHLRRPDCHIFHKGWVEVVR